MDTGKKHLYNSLYYLVYYIFYLKYPQVINIGRLAVQAGVCNEIKYFKTKIEKEINAFISWN